jgi:hypothetical protein
MARGRGGIQGVPDGAGPDTECSTESSWERRLHHQSQARLVSPSGEARAYTSLLPTPASSDGRDRQHGPQHRSTLVLVGEGPAGRGSAETRGSRPRGKHYCATIPARRTWTNGHWYYGRFEGAGRSGGQRYHPDRRPQYSCTRTDRRRRPLPRREYPRTPLASQEGARLSLALSLRAQEVDGLLL